MLIYSLETWHFTKEQEQKLRSAQRGMVRKMLGITWRDRKRATWIREQTKVEDVLMMIKKKKWSWVGLCCVQNRQQMDKEGNGMATKKLQEKPGQAENQVKRQNSGIRRYRMEYTNNRQRKMKGLGKGLCSAVD